MSTKNFNDLTFDPHPSGLGGLRAKIEFPNGYGASVIQTPFSYGGDAGLYELAILKDGEINFDTPITDDVLGRLTEADVDGILAKIEALPPSKQ